mgnify:CR=1 FL=1
MSKKWKKSVSVMLCVAMILSVSSVTVFADGETNPPATEQTQQETETQKPENGETEETKPENETQPEGEGQDETKPEGGDNTEENGNGAEGETPENGNDGDETDENADTEKPITPIEPPVTEEKPGESEKPEVPMTELTLAEKVESQENADDKIDTEDELKTALEGEAVEIVISKDIELTSSLTINRSVTIKGEGNVSLKAGDNVSGNFITVQSNDVTLKDLTVIGNGNGSYTIHFYDVTGGKLDNVKAEGSKGPSVNVNASAVTVNGGTFAGGSEWGKDCGVECSIGAAASLGLPQLTVTGDVKVYIDKATVDAALKLNNGNVAETAKAINNAVNVDGFELVLNADGSIASTDGTVPEEAKGEATLNGVVYDTLKEALAAAKDGDTVTLNKDVSCGAITVPAGVTLKGNGKTLTCTEKMDKGAFVTAGGDNVTLKNMTVDASQGRHGVQFYCSKGGKMENVTVKGGNGTAVMVNGAEVSISGGEFSYNEGGWAQIEYGIGDGVTTMPKLTVTGADVKVHIDSTTVERAKKLNDNDVAKTAKAINDAVNVEGFELVLNADGSIVSTDGTVPEEAKGEATLNGVVYDTLEEAVAAAKDGDTVVLQKDVTVEKMLNITEDITLDLNGKIISAADNFTGTFDNDKHLVNVADASNATIKNGTLKTGSNNKHVLNVWNAGNVTLEDLTLDHSENMGKGAPLVIGNSDVTMKGNIHLIYGKDSWYGINVDPLGGDASLTFGDGASLNVSGATEGKDVVHIDEDDQGENVEVKGADKVGLEKDENGNWIVDKTPTPDPDPKPDPKPEKPSKPSNGGSSNSGSSNSGSSNSGTTVDKEEEDYNEFWDKVIDRINKADEGDTVTVHAGNYDKMPNKVMKALEKNGVGLIIKYNGSEIEIPAGEAVNKSNKLFWSFKELGNYVFTVEDSNEQNNDEQDNEQSNGSENNAQSNTITEQKPSGTVETKPNPQTGSEDYVGLAAALAVTAGVAAIGLGKKKKK